MTDEWLSVSTPYLTPRGDPWAAEAARHGAVGKQRLVEVAELPAESDIAAALEIPCGAPVVVRRRVMLLGERPVELTDSHYPASLARGTGLAEPRRIRGGAVTLLAELGYRVEQVVEDVSAHNPTDEERERLDLRGGPVLQLVRRSLCAGKVFEVSVMRMTAVGRRLRYQLSV
ncbi:UTRA domain-containing protein [Allokutzneria sp. A3M-2-11 16]|uniref:UTRA domain-containing protein n=1 Tax=Allokutzneria sp. A3M-2-11 16 TaxID=2962043 RepID=UPI0020B737F5|nr:UTRA domain-containing protein [Allokutzneria sp. A3M-2-11 16]MCP3801886.1 UTRA domain-containing protein [Allokutzneria sp. A3M-2-11 16]